jgi:hypothetical protein
METHKHTGTLLGVAYRFNLGLVASNFEAVCEVIMIKQNVNREMREETKISASPCVHLKPHNWPVMVTVCSPAEA